LTKPDDQLLLNRLRAGDSDACSSVVRGHYEKVYRFLFHLTRDVHRAEDLTQETFAAAWQRIAAFQGRSTLATWLHRIAYTKFIDGERTARREATLRELAISPPCSPPDPLAIALADDEARRLYRALDELDAAARTLVVLHYLQGMSYSEMARVLDEPNGTVKWRTREAMNALRILLGDKDSSYAAPKTAELGPIS
jgi:RNA polymerase sigma-70 factor, ECF subfamily